jgi:hypothetical protein
MGTVGRTLTSESSSSVERSVWDREVVGSIPASPTELAFGFLRLAL